MKFFLNPFSGGLPILLVEVENWLGIGGVLVFLVACSKGSQTFF